MNILEDRRNRKRKLSHDSGASEEDSDDNKEDNNGLNNNVIDVELEIRRKMERTTMEVHEYPPVTEAIPSAGVDSEHASDSSIPVTPIPLPFTSAYPSSLGLDFESRRTTSYASHSSSLPSSSVIQDELHNREEIQRSNGTEFSAIPSFVTALPPAALPIPLPALGKAETSFNLFDTQLQNSGISAVISDGHFRNSDKNTDGALKEQHQLSDKIPMHMQMHVREYEPVDDVLGCTWDIVTNSCKDLFSLKLCSHCHDFGNIFLHNCKCLVRYITTF